MDESGEPTDAEVDVVIAEFGGDPRAAIRALLHDLAALALDRALTVSRGYVRGRGLPGVIERETRGSNPQTGRMAGS